MPLAMDYGFEEYVTDGNIFVTDERTIFRDANSRLTNHGKVLAALTWYEYLTGNDVREKTYIHESISVSDMDVLKEIAHRVCSLPEYNPAQ